ncbi:MAG: hypothetical protein ACI9T9_000795 [Oleiphilaceae bacterium]|jgi:hypothetical protein
MQKKPNSQRGRIRQVSASNIHESLSMLATALGSPVLISINQIDQNTTYNIYFLIIFSSKLGGIHALVCIF